MKKNTLTTTTLKVDPHAIDWAAVRSQGHFVQYQIPYRESRRWDYLHNWYLSTSHYPYYLNTRANTLYVMYPSASEVIDLVYDGQVWKPTVTDIEDEKRFPALVKLFVSAYFDQRNIFVSNNDFYLLVYLTSKGNPKVLKINIAQQWKENEFYEFALLDSATTMVKADNIKKGNMQGGYYGIDYKDGLPVLRRLNPKKIRHHIQQGVYTRLKRKKYKTTVGYLSVGSEDALKRCRVYHLWRFVSDLANYFNQVGIPFRLKELPSQRVDVLKGRKFAKQPQIDLSAQTVCVVDDRIRPEIHPELEPPAFSSRLVEKIQSLLAEANSRPTLVFKSKADLQAGDLVLRLQDNQASDFKITTDDDDNQIELNKALLRNYSDPYQDYAEEYAHTVSQSLNVNTLTETEEESFDDEEDDQEGGDQPEPEETPEPQSEEAYLGYDLPGKNKLKIPVLNSLNQLYLKDIVRHPQNARQRFDVLNQMRENIFLYAEGLVYLEGDSLVFMPTTNNPEVFTLLKERTGWDLMSDVLLPALNRKKYPDYEDIEDEEKNNILKNCRFIIHPDYVWQIDDSPERVLHNIPEIQRRLRERSKERAKEDWAPTYSPAELAVFEEEKLQAYEVFLDEEVEEEYISFNTLTRKYGKRKEGKEQKGFYRLLGIKNAFKFQKYVTARLGITIDSPKGGDVIPAYTGISYVSETQQYYVGDKYGMTKKYRQDKAFVFRRVVVHRGDTTPDTLLELLKLNLFPLLEVNFIRYKQYTVYPFPFKLIEIWKKISKPCAQ